jgi:hypothetical protein
MSEFGPNCVSPSTYVGTPLAQDDRMVGITGATPLVTNTKTTAFKASDNADPRLNTKLNSANTSAQRSGTGR